MNAIKILIHKIRIRRVHNRTHPAYPIRWYEVLGD
jgi:hypothetical protein